MCYFAAMVGFNTPLLPPQGTCGRPVQRRGAGLQAACALGLASSWIQEDTGDHGRYMGQ